jgi:hypothetical protein
MMFKKQGWHFLTLVILLAGVFLLARGEALAGQLWGVNTRVWLWIAIAVPVGHQVFVGLIWRAQLYHNLMTNAFGEKGFLVYKVIFTVFLLARPISILLVGFSNHNTLICPPSLMYVAAVILLIPCGYGMISVLRYFGLDRAYGIDHFEPQVYREKPFVKQGMFQYTDNVMYKFIFLLFWSIALFTLSKAALLVAAFSHLYIWAHFYFTELPDIGHIYGEQEKQLGVQG